MSHITCPKCGSKRHTTGYGFAAGPLGGYTLCDGCDAVLELTPEIEGLDEETEQRIKANAEAILAETWGQAQ